MNWQRWGVWAGLGLLVACGGGDDADPVPIPPPPPEPVNAAGLWVGSTNAGDDVQIIINEDNVYWALSQYPLTLASGFVQGALRVDEDDKTGETFLLDGRQFQASGEVTAVRGEAVVVPESSLNGTATGVTNVRFNTVFDGRFYQSATFGAVEGNWQASLLNAVTGDRLPYGAVTVSRFGAMTGLGVAGGVECTFTGNIIPEPARGYYSVSLTFSASRSCRLPGQTVNGIAVISGAGADAMLSLAALTTDRWQGVSAVFLPTPPAPTPTPTPTPTP